LKCRDCEYLEVDIEEVTYCSELEKVVRDVDAVLCDCPLADDEQKVKEDSKYVIEGVGNYQLCFKGDEDTFKLIVPLNYVQEDKIIKGKNKSWLVIRHATVDMNLIPLMMELPYNAKLLINGNHKIMDCDEDKAYILETQYQDCVMSYMVLENKSDSFGSYKLIFKLTEGGKIFINKKEIYGR